MYVGTFSSGWRLVAGAAAVAGYVLGRYGPSVKKSADCALKEAIKCGLRTSEEVRDWSAKARTTAKAYVDDVRAEMAREAAAEQAPQEA